MSITFKPAIRGRIPLLFALAGASGSGKTFSALTLAKGLAGKNGTIAVIDTEAGRATHYAQHFNFLHGLLEPPFTPERYLEAIEAAEKAGADVIVIDSMSHEWAGEGGCVDIHDITATRMATYNGELNERKLASVSTLAWSDAKQRHKKMMSRLLQKKAHLIFCLRAEEKIKITKDPKTNKNVVEDAGWSPVCEKNFMYEMTGSLTLDSLKPGEVNYGLHKKLSDELQGIFKNNSKISEQMGEMLRLWSDGKKKQDFADINPTQQRLAWLKSKLSKCTTLEQVKTVSTELNKLIAAKEQEGLVISDDEKGDMMTLISQKHDALQYASPVMEEPPVEAYN